jgi:hypothetical protein
MDAVHIIDQDSGFTQPSLSEGTALSTQLGFNPQNPKSQAPN